MTKTYTNKNQFNYSIKQITIDYTTKTYIIRCGGECRIEKKNATTKEINEKIAECEAMGFTLVKG